MTNKFQYLINQIKHIEALGQDMDSHSWGMEEGILITGNEGKELLAISEENQRLKEELEKTHSLLMETVMRCQIAMPETGMDLIWFEETCAVANSGDYFERLTKHLNLGNINDQQN
jgi:hypothetical protein